MICKIKKGKASGEVMAPPSKSMAHRLLICAAMTEGSVIKNVAFSKDVEATLDCLKALGAKIEIIDNTVKLGGIDFKKDFDSEPLFCNESGSTLRFMIPICLLFGKEITLNGSERLFERSLSVYEEIAKKQNIEFKKGKNFVTVKGLLTGGEYYVRGDISSQFISGLMFALPLLSKDSVINIEGNLESGSYIRLTIDALKNFGIKIDFIDNKKIIIKGGQKYVSCEFSVEGDYSNAAFFDALNILGNDVSVLGLNPESIQGDRVYKEMFQALEREDAVIDISDCPDLGPILMAVAAAKNGGTFVGTKRLKIKESDRGNAIKEELSKMGCSVTVRENEILVEKSRLQHPKVALNGHNDHRIVMSLAVLLTLTGGIIEGVEAVSKSFPDFFEKLNLLGDLVEVIAE